MKEVQEYFEELVKQKSKECSDLRDELTSLKKQYEKVTKNISKKQTLIPGKANLPNTGNMLNPASVVSFQLFSYKVTTEQLHLLNFA